jgi:hypothetical protein
VVVPGRDNRVKYAELVSAIENEPDDEKALAALKQQSEKSKAG